MDLLPSLTLGLRVALEEPRFWKLLFSPFIPIFNVAFDPLILLAIGKLVLYVYNF